MKIRHLLRNGVCAALLMASNLSAIADESHQETALQVASWCQPFLKAELREDGTFSLKRTEHSDKCWGAFIAIQQLARLVWEEDHTRMLDVCASAATTRIQLVKVFVRYVDEHPEIAHEDFGVIALKALWDAFPCSGPKRS